MAAGEGSSQGRQTWDCCARQLLENSRNVLVSHAHVSVKSCVTSELLYSNEKYPPRCCETFDGNRIADFNWR
ncbi:unnamed protein product [Cylicocyclus nassatus]|uniref:Uncharacterized protein n=1 Tax=Cylicocyclus nassatus TaxID=53992 RepID=A0AA36MHK8_CYLNA|nr:unnamed protein product [Cylicocyclus nassatus]